MSFNLVTLEKAIADRLTVSLIGDIQGAAHNTLAPDTAELAQGSKPLVVFTLVSGTYEDTTFSTNVATAVYQVSVYDHRANGLVNLSAVYGKVYGNSEGTDNTPTVGLHRWKITGITDIADCRVEAVNFGTQHDAETLHYWQTFRVYAAEA